MQPQSSERRRREDEPQPAAIREQLERMLANPLFKHSKRYPTLLRHLVDATLDGRAAELKERTLGVQVFGREPNYDTNADPVVRATAGEIRKRIAQYYQEPGHEHEMRIHLSPGSYVPEFAHPPVQKLDPAPVPVPRRQTGARWIGIGIAAVVVAAVFAGANGLKLVAPRTALDRFWAPVLESPNPVLLCIGQRPFLGSAPETQDQASSADVARAVAPAGDHSPISFFRLYYMGTQNMAVPDVATFGRLAGLLQAKGKEYHMLGQSSTSFADLRDGPVVLIGGFNNDWTMRLMGPLRFGFERDNDTFWIRDRQNPNRKDRAVNYSMPYLKLTQDYALISRALEPTTERMVVVVAGLTGFGTIAAGEFLTSLRHMDAMAQQAPSDWEHQNMQLLIATEVINGNSGPPRIIEQHFW